MPLPVPGLPPVIVIQSALLTAVHAQPLWVVTLIVPVPPLGPKCLLLGEMEYVQVIPDCVTVKVLPAIVMVPVLWLVLLLAETE